MIIETTAYSPNSSTLLNAVIAAGYSSLADYVQSNENNPALLALVQTAGYQSLANFVQSNQSFVPASHNNSLHTGVAGINSDLLLYPENLLPSESLNVIGSDLAGYSDIWNVTPSGSSTAAYNTGALNLAVTNGNHLYAQFNNMNLHNGLNFVDLNFRVNVSTQVGNWFFICGFASAFSSTTSVDYFRLCRNAGGAISDIIEYKNATTGGSKSLINDLPIARNLVYSDIVTLRLIKTSGSVWNKGICFINGIKQFETSLVPSVGVTGGFRLQTFYAGTLYANIYNLNINKG